MGWHCLACREEPSSDTHPTGALILPSSPRNREKHILLLLKGLVFRILLQQRKD